MERQEDEDPQKLADEVEEQTNELGQRSEHLEERVIEVRRDWESKRTDEGVPGAAPPDDGEAGGDADDEPPDTPTHKQDPD
jgi:hypothetical protein